MGNAARLSLAMVLVSWFGWGECFILSAQDPQRPFTVADEIGITHFGDPYYKSAEEILFSPDGDFFAVDTERGNLECNCVQDSLRFYRSKDVAKFVSAAHDAHLPSPVWTVNRSDPEGPVIQDWKWLPDSSGIIFVQRSASGNRRLIFADLRRRTIQPLTAASESLEAFDVRDAQHYVYTTGDLQRREKEHIERQGPAIVGTGRSLFDLILPDDPRTWQISSQPAHLWAVMGKKRFEVRHQGMPIVTRGDVVLSPDCKFVATTVLVHDVPLSWAGIYLPPYPSSPYRIRAGGDGNPVHMYVAVGLTSGSIQSMTGAPTSDDAGWIADGRPAWSSDSKALVLPGTFIRSKDNLPSRPCVAYVDLAAAMSACVEQLRDRSEAEPDNRHRSVKDVGFLGIGHRQIRIGFDIDDDGRREIIEYARGLDDNWRRVPQTVTSDGNEKGFIVKVQQGVNQPPLLVAKARQRERVIWNPNPQLKHIDLTDAEVYRWSDTEGRQWQGGLYQPRDYRAGQLYPLVIQTHGFQELEFRPSGIFPTAYAARALAATGIFVLQVPMGPCQAVTPGEGPCVVSGYEAAVHQLVLQGLVDPKRIGIIGFSWPCYHVMEALTTSTLQIKAASVTDGAMTDYFQYLVTEGGSDKDGGNVIGYQDDAIVGAKPFGEGLDMWLKRSPTFSLAKVKAPLLVVGEGPGTLLYMWGVYAGLRYLHKPVELVMLNTAEHVLTNPSVRMASQGGSVDWFRFWLQGYEAPDPNKKSQYKRWRELRNLLELDSSRPISQNVPKLKLFFIPSEVSD